MEGTRSFLSSEESDQAASHDPDHPFQGAPRVTECGQDAVRLSGPGRGLRPQPRPSALPEGVGWIRPLVPS